MWYNYDGLGKRRNKLYANPDDLHWYRWAGWSVLSEYDTTGASGWEIPAAAARVDVAGLAERGAGAAYAYRLHDHLGSVRGLLGASRAPLARYAYAPYGELNHGAGRPLRRGFTGHRWDAESGMYYAPFRYYMPGAGRWLSRDPLGFIDGPNVYGYVGGNPVVRIDTDGGLWQIIPILIGVGIAAYGYFKGRQRGCAVAHTINVRGRSEHYRDLVDYTDSQFISDAMGLTGLPTDEIQGVVRGFPGSREDDHRLIRPEHSIRPDTRPYSYITTNTYSRDPSCD